MYVLLIKDVDDWNERNKKKEAEWKSKYIG